jgi:N-acetyltransferase 10
MFVQNFIILYSNIANSFNSNNISTMKKKIDSRIQTLIDNGVKSHQRSMLVLVGDRSRYQIVNLHFMLTKNSPNNVKPKVLWCYKNDLEFSSHQKKRIK